jgi:hypothetical protein
MLTSVLMRAVSWESHVVRDFDPRLVGGDNQSVGGGDIKGQSLLLASFQYNFDLL